MKLIILNDFGYVDGGATEIAIKTALLASQKMEVAFVCGQGPADSRLEAANIKVTCFEQYSIMNDPIRARAFIKGLGNRSVYRKMKRLLSGYHAEDTVVHVHTWTKCLSYRAISACMDLGFKTVVTMHDYFSACPNGGFYNYVDQKQCDLQPLSCKCITCNCDKRSIAQKWWRVARQVKQRKYIDKNEDIFRIYVSEYCKNRLIKYAPDGEYAVVNNPVPHIPPAAEEEERDSYLFVGRVDEEKGADLFCEAISILGLDGTVIGDGSMLKELKESYPNIRFTGWLNNIQMSGFLNRAIAIIAPSRLAETALLTPMQFMEHGIPCIVPRECAASDYVEDGLNGYLFNTGSVEDLMRAICLMEEKRPEGVRTAMVSDEQYLKQIIDIYRHLLEDVR